MNLNDNVFLYLLFVIVCVVQLLQKYILLVHPSLSVWLPLYSEPIKRRRFRARSITNSKQHWQLFFNENRYLKEHNKFKLASFSKCNDFNFLWKRLSLKSFGLTTSNLAIYSKGRWNWALDDTSYVFTG